MTYHFNTDDERKWLEAEGAEMNMGIVERLRQHALPDPHDEREVMHAPLLKEATDLIEQQAERIKELESALQAADEGRNYANQLLTERSQRVRELQEKIQEMAKEHVEFVLISHSAVCGERDSLKEELAALQKRIDDAPVVGWRWVEADMSKKFAVYEFGIPYSYKHVAKPLISKEDLE